MKTKGSNIFIVLVQGYFSYGGVLMGIHKSLTDQFRNGDSDLRILYHNSHYSFPNCE